MASDQGTVDYLCEQAGLGKRLTCRKMFGEYALYVDGTVVALVCDNQLFLKPTPAVKVILGKTQDLPPFPGAKPHFRLDAEIEDSDLLKRVLVQTALALPAPKVKPVKPKAAKAKKAGAKVAVKKKPRRST